MRCMRAVHAVLCYKCQKRGHIARECPNAGMAVDDTRKVCLRCGKSSCAAAGTQDYLRFVLFPGVVAGVTNNIISTKDLGYSQIVFWTASEHAGGIDVDNATSRTCRFLHLVAPHVLLLFFLMNALIVYICWNRLNDKQGHLNIQNCNPCPKHAQHDTEMPFD